MAGSDTFFQKHMSILLIKEGIYISFMLGCSINKESRNHSESWIIGVLLFYDVFH